MAYGEMTLDGDMNVTPYFEVMYNTQDYAQTGRAPQLFPNVPALNPYNLCNPGAENGVDCGLAYDAYLTNPNIVAGFGNYYEGLCASYGIPLSFCTPSIFGLLTGGYGPVGTIPIVSVKVIEITSPLKWSRFVSFWARQLTFLSSISEPWVTGAVTSRLATPVQRVIRSDWYSRRSPRSGARRLLNYEHALRK